MAGLLGSWWSGTAAEGESEKEKEESEEEEKEKKDSSWVAGLEGKPYLYVHALSVHEVSVGLVKNVSEYAVTVGETVRSKVPETVSLTSLYTCGIQGNQSSPSPSPSRCHW